MKGKFINYSKISEISTFQNEVIFNRKFEKKVREMNFFESRGLIQLFHGMFAVGALLGPLIVQASVQKNFFKEIRKT